MRWLCGLLVVLTLTGCGEAKKPGRVPVFPTAGSVAVKGKPEADVMLLFHPLGDGLKDVRCYARSAADGSFKVSTYETGDGAPEGEFAVTMTWPTVSVEDGGFGEDRWKGKFNNPQSTPFKATIKGPQTELSKFEVQP